MNEEKVKDLMEKLSQLDNFEEFLTLKKLEEHIKNRLKYLKEFFKLEYGLGTHKLDNFTLTIKEKTQKRLDTKKVRAELADRIEEFLREVKFETVEVKQNEM